MRGAEAVAVGILAEALHLKHHDGEVVQRAELAEGVVVGPASSSTTARGVGVVVVLALATFEHAQRPP